MHATAYTHLAGCTERSRDNRLNTLVLVHLARCVVKGSYSPVGALSGVEVPLPERTDVAVVLLHPGDRFLFARNRLPPFNLEHDAATSGLDRASTGASPPPSPPG